MTLLIHGGKVLNATQTGLERGDVLVEGDRIMAVGPNLPAPPGAQQIDATGHIVLPGLVNVHTHAHNHLMKGVSISWTLEDMFSRSYLPWMYAGRRPEEQYISAAIGAIEMLKTGCTAAYDLFLAFPMPTDEEVEAVVRAHTDVGLRALIAPGVADLLFCHGVPGLLELLPGDLRSIVESIQTAPTEGLLRLTENTIRRWHGSADGRIRVAVSPSIPGFCSEEFLLGCGRLVREYGVGLHTHLVESKVQAVHGLHRWGKTVTAHLAELGLVGPDFVGAHAVWLTDDDMRILADAGATVAHNPASNLRLGTGIAPVREMLEHGLTVGLGTDGSASSDNQNMFESMRFAALVGNVRFPQQQHRWIDARAAWEMATAGSARVLGMADDLGAVAAGRKADLVLLRASSVFLSPLNDVLNALVYAETGADVDTVLVGGRVVLEKGRVLTVDEESIYARAQAAVERLRSQNADAWTLGEQILPYIRAACSAAVATPFPVNRYAVPIAGGG